MKYAITGRPADGFRETIATAADGLANEAAPADADIIFEGCAADKPASDVALVSLESGKRVIPVLPRHCDLAPYGLSRIQPLVMEDLRPSELRQLFETLASLPNGGRIRPGRLVPADVR